MANTPTIAISMGDPGGIGAEVIVKSLTDVGMRSRAHFHLYGSASALHDAADRAGIDAFWWSVPRGSDLLETARAHRVVLIDDDAPRGKGEPEHRWAHEATKAGGEASFRWVEMAIRAARAPEGHAAKADAVCTGPISKEAWALAGHARYPGHTELLANRFRAKRCAMMFVGPRLRVVLASVHVPLMDVRNVLTIGRVFDAIDLGAEACIGLGITHPRVAVCGLNPHAGEGGLLGDEETRLIEPAIKLAQQQGIDARGPFPADTIFNAAVGGEGRAPKFDLVVAMYHDQGLIPVKLLFRDESVNVTIGLPAPRTSPDHGTAFDIAGRNKADPGSMRAALELAVDMATRKQHATSK